jgi:hypothetical protein
VWAPLSSTALCSCSYAVETPGWWRRRGQREDAVEKRRPTTAVYGNVGSPALLCGLRLNICSSSVRDL